MCGHGAATPTAWAKLLFWRDLGTTEIGGFGISAAKDPLLIEDVRLVKQICSAVTVRFDDGAVAPGCGLCRWQRESAGDAAMYARVYDHLAPHADADWPVHLELTLSSDCNLACAMCNGAFSSTIRRRREGLAPMRSPYGDEFFEQLPALLAHLHTTKFLGGEPFLAKENLRVWELMADQPERPACHVTTNGTVYTARVADVLAEVLRLADEVPRDFAKVAGSLEQLNQSLREQIVNHDGQRGGVLAEVFSGVDVIENSDAGRSFNAFYRLLLDPELIEGFDAAVDAVLQRGFTNELPLAESAFLRQYLTTLQRESAQVRGTLTDLSRSLRRFVETQEYREHKRLADAIGRAEQVAMAVLRDLPATHPLGLGLDLTSMTISSIGGWTLHNPADVRTSEQVTGSRFLPAGVALFERNIRGLDQTFTTDDGDAAVLQVEVQQGRGARRAAAAPCLKARG